EVDVEQSAEVLHRDVPEGPGHVGAGAVHEDADGAQIPGDPVGQLPDVVVVGHVAGDRRGRPAGLADLVGNRLDLVGGAGGQHHGGALPGEGGGDLPPDAAAGARDDGDALR